VKRISWRWRGNTWSWNASVPEETSPHAPLTTHFFVIQESYLLHYSLSLNFFVSQSHHRKQFFKLDLEIEESPLESKFSSTLMDLMHREDLSASQVPANSPAAIDLEKRVLAGLIEETTKHCKRQSKMNEKRWLKMLEGQRGERKNFLEQTVLEGGGKWDPQSRVSRPQTATTQEGLEREERRLKMDAFVNYGAYEDFNLRNAFGMQVSNDVRGGSTGGTLSTPPFPPRPFHPNLLTPTCSPQPLCS